MLRAVAPASGQGAVRIDGVGLPTDTRRSAAMGIRAVSAGGGVSVWAALAVSWGWYPYRSHPAACGATRGCRRRSRYRRDGSLQRGEAVRARGLLGVSRSSRAHRARREWPGPGCARSPRAGRRTASAPRRWAPPNGSPTPARRPRCPVRGRQPPPPGRPRRACQTRPPRTRRSAPKRRGAATDPSSSLTRNAMSRIRMMPRSTRSRMSGAASPVGCCLGHSRTT
jgi:hypothetical protein